MKRHRISGISIAVIIITLIVAFLYKYNTTVSTFINQQIPTLTKYSTNSVVLGIILLGLIIALMFRIQPDRTSNDDGEDDNIIYPPDSPGHPHPPNPPQPQNQQVSPIIQPIVIQPIIKEPIHQSSNDHNNNTDTNQQYHHSTNEPRYKNLTHDTYQHKSRSNYHKNHNQKKRPIIRNYWQPKKKKRIIRNYWKDPW